jgi:hypothetical protein
MNEEEKEAVEILNTFELRRKTKNYKEISLEDSQSVETILNLIEKLQKENEKLKNLHIQDNKHLDFIIQNSISKQKVKDKIEKLNDESHAEELENIMIGQNYTITELVQYVLQELIEGRSHE